MKPFWQLQEAKNKFSELLTLAAKEPQIITRRGRKAGVLMSYDEYCRKMRPSGQSTRALYAAAPKFSPGELDLERSGDTGRDFRL